MPTRKRAPGCLRCQERHVKCDRGTPTCNSCRNLKYPTVCEYASKRLRFRQSRYSSSVATTNVMPRELDSVRTPPANENDPGAASGASDTTHAPSLNRAGSARTLSSSFPHQSSVVSPVPSAEDTRRFSSSSLPMDGIALTPKPSVPSFIFSPLGFAPVGAAPSDSGYGIDGSSTSIDLSHPIEHVSPNTATSYQTSGDSARTLTEEIDCKVFAFYVERAGHWIDIGSPGGFFHSYVPQLALSDPLLLAACLACASHLMHLLGMVEKEVEQYYSDRVVSLMIPSLSSEKANSSNEALLATVVILRMSEQFLELSSDTQRHLQGAASLFLDGTDWSPVESNLATSCFWTYLRESIRISFLQEQPCPFDLTHLSLCEEDMTVPAPTDGVWTNRMTFLLVRVGALCWDRVRQHPTTESKSLKDLIDKWRAHLPPSFRPWCICENDNEPFPDIRYFAPWHVVAWQFYYAAKVMLAVYFPDEWANKSVHDMHRYIEVC
ncbi:hypothetical protein N7474_008149 [Penicillium riverlandense]|uniref:uncharacterized protein n=1 Tax=Penicillium riverlandense TaxID=1903569 RepID=UPI002549822D|nr:uncharacterized protein N7474_008149 [Penicillium riverlandense]KAJ5811848.1 hypothetical protein N7474_008149 [Penicillium riverlandense]